MTPVEDKREAFWQKYKEEVYYFAFDIMGKNEPEAHVLTSSVYLTFCKQCKKDPKLLDQTLEVAAFFFINTRNRALARLRYLKHGK